MQVGQTLPLFAQASDYNPNKWVKAFLRDDQNAPIGAGVILLPIGALGLYGNIAIDFPAGTAFVTAQYIFYDDSGYADVSTSEGASLDRFDLGQSQSQLSYSYITGFIDGGSCQSCEPNSVQDTIVTGSDKVLNIRLVTNPTFLPFDLTGFTLIKCQLVNADGSFLTLNSTDLTNPIVVNSAPTGQFSCALTKAQTALLGVATPAPMTVTVVHPEGTTIVNLPYQLSIEAPLV